MAQQSSVSEELLADWSADLEAVLYAPEVEEAIQEVNPSDVYILLASLYMISMLIPLPSLFVWQVCPSSDPLDSKDFNPIDYINQLFPTEQVIWYQTSPAGTVWRHLKS